MTDEAMKAMARRIADECCMARRIADECCHSAFVDINSLQGWQRAADFRKAAYAAIIETQEMIAAWLEQYPSPMNDLDMAMRIREICAAIRSGQQFRKDV